MSVSMEFIITFSIKHLIILYITTFVTTAASALKKIYIFEQNICYLNFLPVRRECVGSSKDVTGILKRCDGNSKFMSRNLKWMHVLGIKNMC